MNRIELPSVSGSYRWYYFDVSAGDLTGVCIFMLGSLFSADYSSGLSRGALPLDHCAVNFALYRGGKRLKWVLNEYRGAAVDDGGRVLRVGPSQLHYGRDGANVRLVEPPGRWSAPLEVTLRFVTEGPSSAPLRLVDGLSHHWRPIAPRGVVELAVPSLGVRLVGPGYHDSNWGDVPLGSDLQGWDWLRTHSPEATRIVYRPWADGVPGLEVVSGENALTVARRPLEAMPTRLTGWQLPVPARVDGARPVLLESSPFYARWATPQALGEVADFERFHRPSIRWMARFRTRTPPVEPAQSARA